MIRRLFNLIILIFLSSSISTTTAQKKTIYDIVGNYYLDDQFFINIIEDKLAPGKDAALNAIAKELQYRGYYNFKIREFIIDSLSEKETLLVSMKIDEGPITTIGNIYIDSLNNQDSAEVYSYFNVLVGEVFVQAEVENLINEVLVSLENNGFPFASIIINSIRFFNEDENPYVDLYLELNKENIRKIDKVEIVGNTKTKDDVIINAIRLNKGELYSQERIEEIPSQLNKLRFFENVDVPKYFINSKDEGILQINIKERNTNTFDGILGYVPSQGKGESGYLTGFVNISLRNLFGTGRGAAIKWQQENSLTQELELNYFEPWIFSLPFNLNLNFFQRKQDSSYVKRIFGGGIEYLATENISASVIIESESVIPSLNKKIQSTLNSNSLNTGLALKLDYRDNPLSPTKGTYFLSTYKYRNKTIKDDISQDSPIKSKEIEYHNYEFDFGIFYSIFLNQVLAFGIHGKELIGDYFDSADFFQFGGTNSLRGYREKQFLGNRIIWSNLEYRFLLSASSYVFAFFDSGYYLINENKSINIDRQSDYLNGYGLGISLETALGIMKISYAFAEGGSINNGLIHFGLVNDF